MNLRVMLSAMATVLALPSHAFACDLERQTASISWNLFFIILSAIIGYVIGTMKSFREEKQKAYGEIIPPIAKLAYHPEDTRDEKEYSNACAKLWLYASKKVARKVDDALQIIHDPNRRDETTKALQAAVVEMRKDIQIWSWQKLRPEDVNHLYTKIVGAEAKPDKNNT